MIPENIYAEYFDHLLTGNRKACDMTVRRLLEEDVALKDIHVHLFQRSMYEVGDLWEKNKISVSTEHLATAITESLLTLLYPRLFAVPRIGKKAVVSCVVNEFHQLGGKIVADTFEFHGWDGYYLGADTPTRDLVLMVEEKKPDLVGLSLAVYSRVATLLSVLDELGHVFPGLPVLVGGQAFRSSGNAVIEKYRNASYIPSIDALQVYLNEYHEQQ